MNRDERIEWAKRKAAETSDDRARERGSDEAERSNRIVDLGSVEANRVAHQLSQDSSAAWLGPVATPHEWSEAVGAARAVAIEAPKRRRTITYGELRIAAYEVTGMKVGHNQYAELAVSVNDPEDCCLLSAIIVRADTRRPGSGFLPFARTSGFNGSVATLQRQVFDHFAADGQAK